MKSVVTNGAPTSASDVGGSQEFREVPVTPLRTERVRRPSFIVLGVLLVLLAALAGALLFRASNDRSQALVLRNDLAIGEELTADDLVVVDIAPVPNLQWVPAQEQDSVVGMSARGPLARGQLVADSMFTERAATIGADTVIVSVAVDPGDIPPTAQVGDTVRVQVTNTIDPAIAEGVNESVSLGEAKIWAITDVGTTPGDAIIELAVPVAAEREVSQAVSSGRVKLNLTGEE